jgi:hypothetical protein
MLPLALVFLVSTNWISGARADVPVSRTWWSLQNTNWPPLPWNPFTGTEVFDLGSNHWAYNDLGFDYNQWRADREAARSQSGFSLLNESELRPSPGGGDDDGFDPGVVALEAYEYSSNALWLEIIAFTNHTAALVIHPPST